MFSLTTGLASIDGGGWVWFRFHGFKTTSIGETYKNNPRTSYIVNNLKKGCSTLQQGMMAGLH